MSIAAVSDQALGWLFPDEGPALYEAAVEAGGPFVEIGSYCGKSTVWLGKAAQELGTVVFAVDHHRGSPEMQEGRENRNPEVIGADGAHDTLFRFRQTIRQAGLEEHVVAVVGESTTVAAYWNGPIGLVFIDATHHYLPVRADFTAWACWIRPGGCLAFHDVTIPDIDRVAVEAVDAGFEQVHQVDTLRILRRPV